MLSAVIRVVPVQLIRIVGLVMGSGILVGLAVVRYAVSRALSASQDALPWRQRIRRSRPDHGSHGVAPEQGQLLCARETAGLNQNGAQPLGSGPTAVPAIGPDPRQDTSGQPVPCSAPSRLGHLADDLAVGASLVSRSHGSLLVHGRSPRTVGDLAKEQPLTCRLENATCGHSRRGTTSTIGLPMRLQALALGVWTTRVTEARTPATPGWCPPSRPPGCSNGRFSAGPWRCWVVDVDGDVSGPVLATWRTG
jgi:hypothetical protein